MQLTQNFIKFAAGMGVPLALSYLTPNITHLVPVWGEYHVNLAANVEELVKAGAVGAVIHTMGGQRLQEMSWNPSDKSLIRNLERAVIVNWQVYQGAKLGHSDLVYGTGHGVSAVVKPICQLAVTFIHKRFVRGLVNRQALQTSVIDLVDMPTSPTSQASDVSIPSPSTSCPASPVPTRHTSPSLTHTANPTDAKPPSPVAVSPLSPVSQARLQAQKFNREWGPSVNVANTICEGIAKVFIAPEKELQRGKLAGRVSTNVSYLEYILSSNSAQRERWLEQGLTAAGTKGMLANFIGEAVWKEHVGIWLVGRRVIGEAPIGGALAFIGTSALSVLSKICRVNAGLAGGVAEFNNGVWENLSLGRRGAPNFITGMVWIGSTLSIHLTLGFTQEAVTTAFYFNALRPVQDMLDDVPRQTAGAVVFGKMFASGATFMRPQWAAEHAHQLQFGSMVAGGALTVTLNYACSHEYLPSSACDVLEHAPIYASYAYLSFKAAAYILSFAGVAAVLCSRPMQMLYLSVGVEILLTWLQEPAQDPVQDAAQEQLNFVAAPPEKFSEGEDFEWQEALQLAAHQKADCVSLSAEELASCADVLLEPEQKSVAVAGDTKPESKQAAA